jgi:hypothetical protein
MYYIIESFFVGLYSSIIFLILNKIIKVEINLLIFLTGFAKHFLGMFLQIHTYYCNYGYACKKQSTGLLSSKYTHMLLVECILEGIVFVLFYNVIKRIYNLKTIYIIFIIGILLHILAEKLKIHSSFCEKRCV